MLYAVLENRLGVNVQAAYSDIEIQRDEAWRMDRQRLDEQVAAEAAKDKGKDNARRIEVERRRLKAKEAKKAKAVEIVDKEKDDEDEEDDDLKDIDNFHESDDDDQDGNGGALIVRQPGADQVDDYFNDEQNEEKEDVQSKGHDVEEGELVENWTRELMLEALGMNDENLKFDIEDEIPTAPDSEYVFKFVEDAGNFNDVIVEDDSSDSDQDVPFHYAGQDDNFPTFAELFRTHNEDDLRRKVAKKISTDGPPKTLSEEELREKKKEVV
ncbi:protein ecdysoneless homolog [Helianthus annuus]|uniref:protein ecdysoneless homolog n=1 Tax=Helianthus annuus TaxID=4232 RepID=UPI000B90075F|nr:protein ecdysoneless homolog [Helianthus annuus]